MFQKDGQEIPVETVFDRFMQSADDAGVSREDAASIFAQALAGDAGWRELIEETCDCAFVIGFGEP